MPAKRANRKQQPPRPAIRVNVVRRALPRGISRRSGVRRTATLAPSAVSLSRKMKMSYAHVMVNGRPALRVTATVPICEIGNSGDTYLNALLIQSASQEYVSVVNLTPYQGQYAQNGAALAFGSMYWISPHVPLLALAFDRYRINELAFHYEPQSTAVVSDRMVFAWTDDPAHPFLSVPGSHTNSATPTQLQTLVTSDSVAFMPWKEWSLNVPVQSDIKYLYHQPSVEVEGTSLDRFSNFGSMSCVASTQGAGAIIYGVLYASICIDFIDPVPIVSTVTIPALLSSLQQIRSKRPVRSGEEKKESTDSKLPCRRLAPDDDLRLVAPSVRAIRNDGGIARLEPDDEWVEPSPPPFIPAASSVPGTPSYKMKVPSNKSSRT
jgi:hypothetical protein